MKNDIYYGKNDNKIFFCYLYFASVSIQFDKWSALNLIVTFYLIPNFPTYRQNKCLLIKLK